MGLRDHHEPPDLTPREHPAPNTPQKWLHLSEEAANSFRNDWKEHFISVFNNGSMILDGKINYLCLLAFPISGTYRRLSYQTKWFKRMFLSSLKKFDIFFHPPRQSPPNWMYPLGQHRPGAVTGKCTPPKKK